MIVITNLIYKMSQEQCFTNALILNLDDIYYNGAIKNPHKNVSLFLSAFQRTATESTECYYHPLIFQND